MVYDLNRLMRLEACWEVASLASQSRVWDTWSGSDLDLW